MGAQVDAIVAMCAAQPPLRMVLSRDCDRLAASAARPVLEPYKRQTLDDLRLQRETPQGLVMHC